MLKSSLMVSCFSRGRRKPKVFMTLVRLHMRYATLF
nr:MAG TPA: hypothetical protein [Caudoviricetes sp.]